MSRVETRVKMHRPPIKLKVTANFLRRRLEAIGACHGRTQAVRLEGRGITTLAHSQPVLVERHPPVRRSIESEGMEEPPARTCPPIKFDPQLDGALGCPQHLLGME